MNLATTESITAMIIADYLITFSTFRAPSGHFKYPVLLLLWIFDKDLDKIGFPGLTNSTHMAWMGRPAARFVWVHM